MSEPRVIKKYPNRRLYDTHLSQYVTVADLRQLIVDGVDFEVQDANTGEDISRHILLLIISDQETKGEPLFTTEILTRMIRFYGGASQQAFTDYLGRSLGLFMEQQQAYQDQLTDFLGKSSLGTLSNLAKQNLEIWQEAQQNFLRSAGLAPNRDAGPVINEKEDPDGEDRGSRK
jgi:polyhydroxyalkanoate synthesis repressor PhaR|tara:strand:+ start:263 stop:784 length:522 start_codon:yes stop_codon:yes gene_type:complete